MPSSPRRRARELVLKRLYAAEFEENSTDRVIETVVEEESPLSPKTEEFARQFFLLVHSHHDWADGVVSALAQNWELSRLALIDRIILRMALVEIEHMPDTPVKVAINEAIELAKQYSTAESSSFINGILDKYVRDSGVGEKA